MKDSIKKCCEGSNNASSSVACRKLIFPTLCSIFFNEKSKGDIRVAAGEVLKEMQRNMVMGGSVSDWCEDRLQQNELQRILRS